MGSETPPRGDASHVAVLLAAGASTRLGTPKQLLTRDGEPLVRRTARLLLETSPRELVIVLGAQHAEVGAALHGLPHRSVVNDAWREGMASSLRCAAALVTAERVLIAVCDQPALEAAHLHALLAAGGCAATLHGDRPGVPAVLDAALWASAGTLQGDRGFAGLLGRRTGVVSLPQPALDLDIDTPQDLAAARSRGWID